jgi:hypothetical protein
MSYEVYRMDMIDGSMPGTDSLSFDAFICFDTPEDRSFFALRQLCENTAIQNSLILSFSNDNAVTSLVDLNVANGIKATSVTIEKNLSASLIPCLREIEKFLSDKQNVGIDISCMPIPVIAQILHFLRSRHKNIRITIFYTEPDHYTLNNLFDYSAYGGEIDIKAIPGFEGETSQVDEVKRVVFYIMGFEMTYLSKLIPQDVNPDEIAPINGFPSYYQKYKDISLINNNSDFYEKDIKITYSEANNPFEAYNTMLMLEEKYKDYRIDIIPVGTKPMALGACLYALRNDNINCRIIFPFPSEYKPNQSIGCGKLWKYRL